MCALKTVKSTRNREFLKPERLAKLTEVGKLFHTRTILSAKNRLRALWLQWDLYSLYAWHVKVFKNALRAAWRTVFRPKCPRIDCWILRTRSQKSSGGDPPPRTVAEAPLVLSPRHQFSRGSPVFPLFLFYEKTTAEIYFIRRWCMR